MSQEAESVPLKSIHIDLETQAITFTGSDGRAISFNPRSYLERLLLQAPTSDAEPLAEVKEQLVTLAGRLKTLAKDGRGDSKGRPTAWALFASHQDGDAEAKMYLTTFHGAARNVALTLPKEASIVVTGYPHKTEEEGKNDTLSVMRIDNYPGKQLKGNGS